MVRIQYRSRDCGSSPPLEDMPVVELYLIKYINQVYEKKVLINNYLDMVFHIENNDYLKSNDNVSNV